MAQAQPVSLFEPVKATGCCYLSWKQLLLPVCCFVENRMSAKTYVMFFSTTTLVSTRYWCVYACCWLHSLEVGYSLTPGLMA